MAIIRINDLQIRTIIGTHSWEKTNKQELLINLTIEYDSSHAENSDKLQDAIDYQAIAAKVTKLIERARYQLLEKLARKVLDAMMADSRIFKATVRIDKPQALPEAKSVALELSDVRSLKGKNS